MKLFGIEEHWIEKIQDAKDLTIYGVSSRYPEKNEQVSKEEAYQAVSIADNVKQVVRLALLDNSIMIDD